MDPALTSVLARAARELPAPQLAAWAGVLRACPRPSPPVEERLLACTPYAARAGLARQVVRAWRDAAPETHGAALALSLETAAAAYENATRDCDVRLAVTGPTSDAVPMRFTSEVVVEVIRAARRRLLLVSFAAYKVPLVVDEVRAAAGRGVHVDIVLESSRSEGGSLRHDAAAAFAGLAETVTLWHWPGEHRPAAGSSRAALHAKLVLADDHTALLGSANLTGHALTHNIEVGAVLRGRPAGDLSGHFTHLMHAPGAPLTRLA